MRPEGEVALLNQYQQPGLDWSLSLGLSPLGILNVVMFYQQMTENCLNKTGEVCEMKSRVWKWDRLMPHACLIYYSKQKLPQKQDWGIQRDGMKAKLLFSLSKYTFLKMAFCRCFSFLSHKVPSIPNICLIFPSKSTWNVSHAFLQQKQLYIIFPSIFFSSCSLELYLLFLLLYLYDFYKKLTSILIG